VPVVTIDSRRAAANTIFFALQGDSFNGNEYAASALEKGCKYVVIDEERYYKDDRYVLVKDSLRALQELAKHHRSQLTIPFIAITGSNGKTTTKEYIHSVLSKKFKVLATAGNLNNHIGAPLTLLAINSEIEIAIIEMGANHVGEIASLCDIAKPDFGLITNIGKAHIGEFGSFENIVKGKTEMYQYVKQHNGKLFINTANHLLVENAVGIEQISYGENTGNDCVCKLEEANPFIKISYNGSLIVSQLIGSYNFENIAASICIGKYFGIPTSAIKEAIEEYIPSNNRSQIVKKENCTIVLDAYNANPSSMKAAMENFSEMEGDAKWLILGDMLELGEYEIEEHKSILKLAAEKKIKNILLVGERFRKAVKELKIPFPYLRTFNNSEELINHISKKEIDFSSTLILIKGSRGIKLEKVVDYL